MDLGITPSVLSLVASFASLVSFVRKETEDRDALMFGRADGRTHLVDTLTEPFLRSPKVDSVP